MKKIVLPITVCFVLLVGCVAPAVVQPTPEPEVVLPTEEEPILVWEPIIEEPIIEEEQYVPKHQRRVPKVVIGDRALVAEAPPVPFYIDESLPRYSEFGGYKKRCLLDRVLGGLTVGFDFYEPRNCMDIVRDWEELVEKKELVEKGLWEKYIEEDLFDPSLEEYEKEHPLVLKQFLYEFDRELEGLRNPTFQELMTFLVEDKTEEIPYVEYVFADRPPKVDGSTTGCYVVDGFVCEDFAMLVQLNANSAALRCALLSIGGHALNAFETTDKGLVWVCSIGSDQLFAPCNDKDDLYPILWSEKDEPPPLSNERTLTHVVYIW